jgi:hypothetical protein
MTYYQIGERGSPTPKGQKGKKMEWIENNQWQPHVSETFNSNILSSDQPATITSPLTATMTSPHTTYHSTWRSMYYINKYTKFLSQDQQ